MSFIVFPREISKIINGGGSKYAAGGLQKSRKNKTSSPFILNLRVNKKATPINTKKTTELGFGVFQGKVLLLNIVLRLNFTREAEIVTLIQNNCQLPSCLRISKYSIKIQRL